MQDTASFVKAIFHRCYGLEEQPFTLAIAGYGTGKSHLGLTLGRILGNPNGKEADEILLGIESAKRAGCTVIGMATTHPRSELEGRVDSIVSDFIEASRLFTQYPL